MIKKELEKELSKIVKETLGLNKLEITLEHPANESFGDFTTNVALKVSKELKQSPAQIAGKLIETFKNSEELKRLGVEKIEPAGPGFINFFLSTLALAKETVDILGKKDRYGQGNFLSGQKLMVEFAHPNTHKQFHVGHLRNISLGESLVRLLESAGAKVVRVNYQGDVGLHVAKALWGILNSKFKDQSSKLEMAPIPERIEFLGKCYVEGHTAYEGEHKVEVVDLNKKIYAKDPQIMPLWQKTRAWSLEYFDWLYQRLTTHYDRLFFESEVAEPGAQMAKEALKRGILKKSEGAVIFDGTPVGLDKRVFLNSEGLPTYEAKELGLAQLEFSEFGQLDRLIHVVGPEQQSFFKVTFKVEELLDPAKYEGKQYHYVYGYVQLKDGKMSSRKGNVVTAVSVIEDAKVQARQLSNLGNLSDLGDLEKDEIAEKVAVGAVKYSLLRADAKNDIAFDLKESIALEGNSGPYLQYTYARAQSVLRKSQELRVKNQGKYLGDLDSEFVIHDSTLVREELALLRTLYKFPEVVESAALNYSPHLVANFLFDLAQKFNLFYNNVKILDENQEARITNQGETTGDHDSSFIIHDSGFRLALTVATAQVIKNGLFLLGIEAPERM